MSRAGHLGRALITRRMGSIADNGSGVYYGYRNVESLCMAG